MQDLEIDFAPDEPEATDDESDEMDDEFAATNDDPEATNDELDETDGEFVAALADLEAVDSAVRDADTGIFERSEVRLFLSASAHLPPLDDREEQVALFTRMLAARSEAERRKICDVIFCRSMKLVVYVAKGYIGSGVPLSDMLQDGCFGLRRAIELYECERGFKFATYAHVWIRQSITRGIRNTTQHRPMRLPVHLQDTLFAIAKAIQVYRVRYGELPNPLQICETIRGFGGDANEKMTLRQVAKCLRYLTQRYDSLNRSLPNGDGNNTDTYGDIVADPFTSPEAIIEAKRLLRENLLVLDRVMELFGRMSPRTRGIMHLRLGLGELDPLTLEEIATHYCLTRERIRQIELKAVTEVAEKLGLTYDDIIGIVDTIDNLRKIVASDGAI
jgi:RNA polymerase primary sigma factor